MYGITFVKNLFILHDSSAFEMRNSSFMIYWIAFLLCTVISPVFGDSNSTWPTLKPQDTKIARLYVAMLDRDIEIALPCLDATHRLPAQWPKDASGIEINPLPMQLPKNAIIRSAELASALAHAYCIASSTWYNRPEVLTRIQKIVSEILNQSESDPSTNSNGIARNTLADLPLLEPLATIDALVSNRFSIEERQRLHSWLLSRMNAVLSNPIRWQNDRGMEGCAILSLAARMTGEAKYQQAADRIVEWFQPLISSSGEYLDPAGLDIDRASRFLRSLFLYRWFGGKSEFDPILVRCLSWYTRLFSTSGVPLVGIQYPSGECYRTLFVQMLGLLTYYATNNPPFNQIATQCMESLLDLPPGFTLEYGAFTFLLGCVYHHLPEKIQTPPYSPYAEIYGESPNSLYALIGKNYQTAIVLSDSNGAKGLQVWSYMGQPPLLFPSPPRFSKTAGFGYDSHQLNVFRNGRSSSPKMIPITDTVDVLIVPGQGPSSAYVFSYDATIAVHRQPFDDSVFEWILDNNVSALAEKIEANRIRFSKSNAQLILPPDTIPNYEDFDRGVRLRLHFKSEFCWYTLAGPESRSVVQPVHSGLIFIHIKDSKSTLNLLVNLSPDPFKIRINFPGTSVPIPEMDAWSASLIKKK